MTATDSTVQQGLQALQDVQNKVQDFMNQVNDGLSSVPSFLSDLIKPIIDGMNLLNQKLQEFWSGLERVIDNPGSPSALNQVAANWENSVASVVTGIAGTL